MHILYTNANCLSLSLFLSVSVPEQRALGINNNKIITQPCELNLGYNWPSTLSPKTETTGDNYYTLLTNFMCSKSLVIFNELKLVSYTEGKQWKRNHPELISSWKKYCRLNISAQFKTIFSNAIRKRVCALPRLSETPSPVPMFFINLKDFQRWSERRWPLFPP